MCKRVRACAFVITRHITTWAKQFVEDALDFLDTLANLVGAQSELDSLLQPLRDQLDDLNYDVMKQYAMQVIVQKRGR
jgi:hypothetical protein